MVPTLIADLAAAVVSGRIRTADLTQGSSEAQLKIVGRSGSPLRDVALVSE